MTSPRKPPAPYRDAEEPGRTVARGVPPEHSQSSAAKPPPAEERPAEPRAILTPVSRKIGEARGNLRDRAAAFNRRRGGKT